MVFTGGGFEPGDLAAYIAKSLKSDQPLPPNPNANTRLRNNLSAALRPPDPQPVPKLPALSAYISGKAYTLSANQLDLANLSLQFDKASEATLRLQRLGKELRCAVGLDGIERFSTDTLAELPFACKGRWLNADTFLLELDRVAGISLYRFELTFTDEGNSLAIAFRERSGLGAEVFKGRAKP